MTTTPVDEWQQECPHPTLAQDDRLIELIELLGLVVGWQAARVADLEDTVRRLGDEADRLVTERDEARRAVGLAGTDPSVGGRRSDRELRRPPRPGQPARGAGDRGAVRGL